MTDQNGTSKQGNAVTVPSISLPKSRGAIHGIGEKFGAKPLTGNGWVTIPIVTTACRLGFSPQLSVAYDSCFGKGPFSFRWSHSLSAVTRKTDKGLSLYWDGKESDVFILSVAKGLLPTGGDEGIFASPSWAPGYSVDPDRRRIADLFARIQRWTENETGFTHWSSISRGSGTTHYGRRTDSRAVDVFTLAHELKRTSLSRSANCYLKRIKCGNLFPHTPKAFQ